GTVAERRGSSSGESPGTRLRGLPTRLPAGLGRRDIGVSWPPALGLARADRVGRTPGEPGEVRPGGRAPDLPQPARGTRVDRNLRGRSRAPHRVLRASGGRSDRPDRVGEGELHWPRPRVPRTTRSIRRRTPRAGCRLSRTRSTSERWGQHYFARVDPT